jgi:hypothetical protein
LGFSLNLAKALFLADRLIQGAEIGAPRIHAECLALSDPIPTKPLGGPDRPRSGQQGAVGAPRSDDANSMCRPALSIESSARSRTCRSPLRKPYRFATLTIVLSAFSIDARFEQTQARSPTEGQPMRLTFLGKVTQGGNSPTLWQTDDDQYIVQGFTLDAEALGQVGAVPGGEAVLRVPKQLMRYLKEADGATEL